MEEIGDDLGDVNIYAIPPIDENDTDQDSDASDEEHEGNLNHLGRKLLCTEAEIHIQNDDVDSDDEPLAKYQRTSTSRNRNNNNFWRKIDPSYTIVTQCEAIPISVEAQNCKTPIEFFELFFTDDLLSHIADQSNLYALQKNTNLDISSEELKVFLGALLLSGYAKYPNRRFYWSDNMDSPQILSNSMRLKRFEKILANIHLNDNTQFQAIDRLYKLRPLITHLNEAFLKHGGLDENLSIDESMIPYYGKHFAKQYIRGKPIRFGFKNWALNSSEGYLYQFDIYMGKNSESTSQGFGVGGDKVIDLLTKSNVPHDKGFKVRI